VRLLYPAGDDRVEHQTQQAEQVDQRRSRGRTDAYQQQWVPRTAHETTASPSYGPGSRPCTENHSGTRFRSRLSDTRCRLGQASVALYGLLTG
jgi:hypothetical protein